MLYILSFKNKIDAKQKTISQLSSISTTINEEAIKLDRQKQAD